MQISENNTKSTFAFILSRTKRFFPRQVNNIQQENDCQTSDMYNNSTSHVSGPGLFM